MQDGMVGKENVGLQGVWAKSVALLRDELDPQIFAAYIRPLSCIGFDKQSSEISITAPSRLVCKHVSDNFKDRIAKLLSERLGCSSISLNFSVDDSLTRNGSCKAASPYVIVKKSPALTAVDAVADKTAASGQDFGESINNKYNFTNFVVGNSNQFCNAAAMRVAEEPGKSYNPLFIYGGVGLGKTHLLHAIANSVLKRNPHAKVLYMSSETFTNQLIHSLRFSKMEAFKKRLREIELLLVDDIQFIRGKERTQEEFFHTFNALYSAKNQIVITSDKIPQEIPEIEERLKTRFSWGLIADLQAPDFETRVAILKRKATSDGFALPQEVSHLIAERISSNVRELEGALTKLHAVSSIHQVPITKDLAQSALRDILQPKKINISISDIKSVVAEHFSIKVSDMVSKRRTRNLSFPRHVAMYLCRKHTTASYPEIGSNFGGRDHSSVIHAANVVAAKLKDEEPIREHVAAIENSLFGSSG